MRIDFAKPFNFEGKEYTGLDLDLDGLTGQDLLDCEKQVGSAGAQSLVMETNKTYLTYIAARAAKVLPDLILALPAKEFSKLTVQVQGFLLS